MADKKKLPDNDLAKDLAAANESVTDLLNAEAIKQGAHLEGVDSSKQNDPENRPAKPEEESIADVVAGAVEDKKKK